MTNEIKDIKTRVLVSGYIGFNNFGDEAIFYALSKHLKENNIDVSVLCNNPETVCEKYQVNTYYFKTLSEIFSAIWENDILISGGGSLLQNKTSNFSLFYYLFIILLAKLLFKKVVIFAQGIEPIKGFFQTLITALVLKSANFVSVRDEKSQNLLKKWTVKSNLLSDPIYSILEHVEIEKEKKDLVIQLRNAEGMSEEFLENLAENVFMNFKDFNVKVFSFQDDFDDDICKFFIQQLEQYNFKAEFISNKTIEETIDIVNKAQFMISTRLHGIYISQALKTKTFALAYDEKIKTVVEELNIDYIDINNVTKEELAVKLKDFSTKNIEFEEYRKFDWKEIDEFLTNRG